MKKILVSGFGGQGVLSLGIMVANSAMYMNYNTSWLPSYGPEMRGGTAHCNVVYASGDVASPVVSRANFVVVMNEPSLGKFEQRLDAGGTMLVNTSIVQLKPTRTDIKIVNVPADEMADKLKNPRGGNVIMLGVMIELFGDIKVEAARKAIETVFADKPELIAVNLKCLESGIEYAKKNNG